MAKELSQLEQTVIDLINKSVSAVEKGADWLSGQIPDVAEQFLRYKLYESIFLTVVFFSFFVLVTVVSPLVFRKLYLSAKKRNSFTDPDNFVFPSILIAGFGNIFAIPGTILYLKDIIKLLIAPKVYLIEWASSLVR